MMSLTEVQRAAEVLEARLTGTLLQRVVQLDDLRLVMEFYGQAATQLILFSCHPRFAHISALTAMPKAPSIPRAFAQYLRAHLGRAAFERILTSVQDRRLEICLRGDAGAFVIVLSILGTRSNIYLLGHDRLLLFAMRPLAATRRGLVLGEPWTDPEGSPRSAGIDRWKLMPAGRYLESVEETYCALERNQEAETLARRLAQAFDKEAEFLARKAVHLLEDLGEVLQAEEYRKKGELLKLALHSIRPGDESVSVTNYATGATVVISLDPRLSPAENLNTYFKRYQKELRGARALQQQLDHVRRTQDELAGFRQRLSCMLKPPGDPLAALQAMSVEPRVRKLLSRRFPTPKPGAARLRPPRARSAEITDRLQPRRYRTETGLEIWVGRNEEGNDYLTTRLARGNDLFFHLEGYPGSHVILRTQGRSDPPPQSLLDACELAVHFSKMKSSRQADVHVTPVKNVKKPKGAKPGLVYVTRGKTIHLRRDPKRLENILASRLDE